MKTLQINLKKYMPTILSFLACGGVVGTAIVASKDSLKASKALEERRKKEKILYAENEKYAVLNSPSKKEILLIYVKNYIPTILMGAGTMACILGSNGMNQKTQMGLISAYGLLNESYKDYRNKVIEKHGIDNHRQILDEIAVEKAEPPYVSANAFLSNTSINDKKLSAVQPKQLFYDEYSGRYFESTLVNVLEAEYHINRNFCLGKVVTANEWYEFLGIEQTIDGNEAAWYLGTEDELFWLDFDNSLAIMPDGTEYIRISMMEGPSLKWQEEFYELPF